MVRLSMNGKWCVKANLIYKNKRKENTWWINHTDNKPVINEKVIFLSIQCLPDIGLMPMLSVECDVLRQPLLQHAMQLLCLRPLVVNDHVGHILQTSTLQLTAQAVHSAERKEIWNYESKNPLLRNKRFNKASCEICLTNKYEQDALPHYWTWIVVRTGWAIKCMMVQKITGTVRYLVNLYNIS